MSETGEWVSRMAQYAARHIILTSDIHNENAVDIALNKGLGTAEDIVYFAWDELFHIVETTRMAVGRILIDQKKMTKEEAQEFNELYKLNMYE